MKPNKHLKELDGLRTRLYDPELSAVKKKTEAI